MGLYTATFRADGTVLTGFGSTSDIFNADHLNHVTHTAAEFLNSWETDVAQMRLTHAPVTAGAISLPAALFEEFERLRYQIALIKQKISGAATPPFWYIPTADFTNGISPAPVACRVETSIPFPFGAGAFTQMFFNVEVYDTAGMAAGSQIIIPANGVYTIGASFRFGDGVTNPSGRLIGRLRAIVPGPIDVFIAEQQLYAASAQIMALNFETTIALGAGTIITLQVFRESTQPGIPIVTATERPAMWAALNGRTS